MKCTRYTKVGSFIAVVVGALIIVLTAGCNTAITQGQGSSGTTVIPGPTGSPGLDAGSDLPGTVVTIVEVNDGGAAQPGESFDVTFGLATLEGDFIPIDELDRLSVYVSGSTTNYQRVIVPEGDLENNVVANADGTYTYEFVNPFPNTFAEPPNDSPAYGPADGELTGVGILAGTHTIGIEARRTFTVDGEELRDAGDATFDFGVNGAPVISRQVVLESNCEKCHAQLTLHGGNRFSVTGCVLCHVDGAEDRISDDPSKATPGASIQLANMIHSIHRGVELPTVAATRNSGDPFRYQLIGFGDSAHDYSDVRFPVMPGGTGFNEQVRNCGACHDGAAQGERAYTNPTRASCGGCHNDIDWTTGTRLDESNPDVAGGLLTKDQLGDAAYRELFLGAIPHTFADGTCIQCHSAGNPALDPAVVHPPPLSRESLTTGLQVEILSVTGGSAAGVFSPGDLPRVTFQINDRSGNPVDIADVASVNLVVSGPVENYQHVLPTTGTTMLLKGAGGVPESGVGPFTFTSPEAIPDVYPPPLNDSSAFDHEGGWGELAGRPLVSGSYTVLVYTARQFQFDEITYREASRAAVFPIRIGSSGVAASYAGTVTDTTCNACHGDLRFHGNSRIGVEGCVMCHTGGAEDRPNVLTGQTQAPEPDSIDFRVMIHKIHNARELQVVKDGGVYDLVGFAAGQTPDTGNALDFSTGILPTMPGEAKHCTACHATDAWKSPVEREDRSIWKIACTSCHDSNAVSVHVQLNSLGVGQEGCATCHGDGSAFSVEKVHKVRITGLR